MEEFIDIVDENGKELNISESRKLAHKKGLWHKASGVIIINKKNEVLLQQRSILKEKKWRSLGYKRQWTYSIWRNT